MSNLGLERRFAELGVAFERSKVGDRYVLESMLQKGWLYGGESSGHLLCLDCHTTGDGIIAALQVLTAMRHSGQSLAETVGDLKMYPQEMVNVPLKPGTQWETHPGLLQARERVERELAGRGRVLIRASGTEPKLRLMVEAEDQQLALQGVRELVAADLTKR